MASATFGFGEGLASVVAREIAERFCSKIAPHLGNLVSDFGSNAQVLYLHITNRTGEIESSTNPLSPGRACARVEQSAIVRREETSIRVLQSDAGSLEFQGSHPIPGTRVGEVYPSGWMDRSYRLQRAAPLSMMVWSS